MTQPPEAFVVRAFAFACKIVHLHATLNRIPRFPFSISRQLLRSGTSIGANLEEARSASSRRDLAARFEVALREARETHYWLRLIAATSLAPADLLAPLTREANELISILHTSVKNSGQRKQLPGQGSQFPCGRSSEFQF
jgi:four helix bundle protein